MFSSIEVHPSVFYINMVFAFRKESIQRLKAIVDAVHHFGTKVFNQLTHIGNQGKSVETLQPLWMPSPIPDMMVREILKEMSVEENSRDGRIVCPVCGLTKYKFEPLDAN